MVKRIGEVLGDSIRNIDRELFEQRAVEYEQKLRSANVDDEIIENEMRAVRGGKCPHCGTDWRLVEIDNALGRFWYYESACACELKDTEVARRKERLETILTNKGIPTAFRTASFESWNPKVDPRITEAMGKVRAWAQSLDWTNGMGLILYGSVGAGKTHCAVSALREIVARRPGARVLFVPMAELLGRIIKHEGSEDLTREISANHVVVVDDVDKVASEKEWARSQVFSLFDALYREGRAAIITTNVRNEAEMTRKFGESVTSRWAQKCRWIEFPGEQEVDYRYR